MTEELKHYGVPGMKWGRRMARAVADNTGRNYFKKQNERTVATAKAVGSAAKAVGSGVSKAANAIGSSKAAKVIADNTGKNYFKKQNERSKQAVDALLNNAVFKAMVFDKDNGGFIRKDVVKKDLTGLRAKIDGAKKLVGKARDAFHRNQIGSQDRDIKLFKQLADEFKAADKKKPLSDRDRKLMDEYATKAKEMEDELNSLFTPEELKKYRS